MVKSEPQHIAYTLIVSNIFSKHKITSNGDYKRVPVDLNITKLWFVVGH